MPEFHAEELAAWSRGEWDGGRPPLLRGLSTDTRALQPGQVFLALKGERFDAHLFLEQAFKAGAAAAIVNRSESGRLGKAGPYLLVDDTRHALHDIAAGYRKSLSTRFIAVTGSSGKTTVKEMTADALSGIGPTARSLGNWNNDIGLPLSLLALEREAKFGVFELGMSAPGELLPLCSLLAPEVGIITAIGPAHIEFFKSEKGIAEEKAVLFANLPAAGVAVASADEKWFEVLKSRAACRLVTTGIRHDADYVAERRPGSMEFMVRERASGERAHFMAPLPGEYVVHDALLAIAAARVMGAGWDLLRERIRAYKPLKQRWQVQEVEGVQVVNDTYNANPLSMRAAIKAFDEHACQGAKWLVLGGMLELGAAAEHEHQALGSHLAGGHWDGLVVVGARGGWIADGAAKAGFPSGSLFRCADAEAAAAVLRSHLKRGDAALLKASRGERLERILDNWGKEQQGAVNGA